MNAKVITCVDSCHFCKRQGFCKHFGEEGYTCTSHKLSFPNDGDMGGDADLGISYASETY